MSDLKRVRKARIVHRDEVWEATVGQQLRMVGRYVTKRGQGKILQQEFATSSATVLEISAASGTLFTDGKGGQWEAMGQFADMTTLEYFDE